MLQYVIVFIEYVNIMNKYVNRLLEEWKQYGKIIIAVDFDDTISIWRKDFNKEDITRCINLLREVSLTGAYIVVFTACKLDRYEDIQKHCEELKLPISAINRTPIELPYGNNSKIYANIFLDDRAGFVESMNILEEALYHYRSYQQLQKPATDVA